jgi:hypothetical protein
MKTRTTKRRSATDRREFLASDLAKTDSGARSYAHEILELAERNLPSIGHSVRTALAATASVVVARLVQTLPCIDSLKFRSGSLLLSSWSRYGQNDIRFQRSARMNSPIQNIAGARRVVLLVRRFRCGRGGEFLEARIVPERIEHRIEPE